MISSKYEFFTNLRTTNSSIVRLFDCSIVRHSVVLWLLLPTVYCLLPTIICTAQDKSEVLKYARAVVDTLASPSMHGRGYVMKGDSIAADYISNTFKSFKLMPFTNTTYYQSFSFSANTIGYSDIYWSGVKLNPAIDYLIGSSSCSHTNGHGSFALWFDSTVVSSPQKIKKFFKKLKHYNYIIVDDKEVDLNKSGELFKNIKDNKTNAKGIFIIEHKKLTHDIATFQDSYPTIKLLIPDSINIIKSHKKEKIHMALGSNFLHNYQSQNVIGCIKGSQYPDSFIVFTAHYDHLGMMGKDVYFPGANDNASGCAMLLNFTKYFSERKPKYSVAFMAFGAEEVGLIGSKYYVEHPLFPLKQIKFLVNFDIVGTGDEGIKVVNATEHKKEFDELVNINTEKNYLPSVQSRGKAGNSDHHFFEEAGVKTFYIYTLGGIKAYHDIYDRAETLPLTKFEELYRLIIDFTNGLQD